MEFEKLDTLFIFNKYVISDFPFYLFDNNHNLYLCKEDNLRKFKNQLVLRGLPFIEICDFRKIIIDSEIGIHNSIINLYLLNKFIICSCLKEDQNFQEIELILWDSSKVYKIILIKGLGDQYFFKYKKTPGQLQSDTHFSYSIEDFIDKCNTLTNNLIYSEIQTFINFRECVTHTVTEQHTHHSISSILQIPRIELFSSTSDTIKTTETFHDSIKKEAIRLEYAINKEKYKKEMRQSSIRSSDSNLKNNKMCKAKTKRGKICTNKALIGSDYCGIISHSNLEEKKSYST